jgi:hypothetical protein
MIVLTVEGGGIANAFFGVAIKHAFPLYMLPIHALYMMDSHSLYFSSNSVKVIKSRRMRWAGHVAHMGEGRGVYRVLVGRPERKRPPGRPRHSWEDYIKMDLRETGMDGTTCIRLAQDRVQWHAFVYTVMNLRVP